MSEATAQQAPVLLEETRDGVRLLTLNRPSKKVLVVNAPSGLA